MLSFDTLRGVQFCLLLLTLQDWMLTGTQADPVPYSSADYKCPRGSVLFLEAKSSRQELQSINWPDFYENNEDCRWMIRAPENTVIQINIVFYNIQSNSFRLCSDDALVIYDGLSNQADCKITFCGPAHSSLEYITSSNVAFIHFFTDDESANNGFLLRYQYVNGDTPSNFPCNPRDQSSLAEGQCPEHIMPLDATSDLQTLTSYKYPEYYQFNQDCWWKIRAPEGVLKITVLYHDIGHSTPCEGDALVIYGGTSAAASQSVCKVELCGETRSAKSYITSSNEALINFHTDYIGSGRGFILKYQYVDRNTEASVPCTPLEPITN